MRARSNLILVGLLIATFHLTACDGNRHGPRSSENADWPTVGGDSNNTRFSPLADISDRNVGSIGLAWEAGLDSERVQESSPVVVDGIMYVSASLGRVFAFDAETGKRLWKFDPDVDMQVNRYACCDQANRGIVVANGLVYVASLDGFLYALRTRDGSVSWRVNTLSGQHRNYTITGAPTRAANLIVIGNAGSEFNARGFVTAYDAKTGRKVWRFYTVPRNPSNGSQESPALDIAVKTWDRDSRWDIGGGGTVWDAILYDSVLDTIYIGVGNGVPYPRRLRSPKGGDNLFLGSVVALNRRDGSMKWYYQETPGESWDSTSTQQMIMSDVHIDGKIKPALIHAPKNGFLYVIDRTTGRPVRAHPLVRINWARRVNLSSGRPEMRYDSNDYTRGPKIIFPSTLGARSWDPPAYSPQSQTYFASVIDMGTLLWSNPTRVAYDVRGQNSGLAGGVMSYDLDATLPSLPLDMRTAVAALPETESVRKMPWSAELRAVDVVTGRTRWAVPLESWRHRAGVLATAGNLVVQGGPSGRLKFYAQDTGRLVKSIDTFSSIHAAPITYKKRGIQYFAVATGWGGAAWPWLPSFSAAYKYGNRNKVFAFRIGGKIVPEPAKLPELKVAPVPPSLPGDVTAAQLEIGQALFFKHCAACHFNQPRSTVPDLRRMTPETHKLFSEIVLNGRLLANGMPRWSDVLTRRQVSMIHRWLIYEQVATRKSEMRLVAQGKVIDIDRDKPMVSYSKIHLPQ